MTRAPSSPPPADEPPDWEALGRFLTGEAAPAEAEAIAAWLAEHPEDAQLMQALGEATAPRAENDAPIDTEAALAAVLARRVAHGGHEDIPSIDRATPRRRALPSTPNRSWRPLLAAAATLAVVVAGGVWWSARTESPSAAIGLAARAITAPGVVDTLRLPDGTEVVLGPGSSLTPSATYGTTDRDVQLDGDGYFVVERDDARPFTVHTRGARVVDLGTAFTVHTDGARGVSVMVTSGRVRLGASHTSDGAVELAAGDAATLWFADTTVRRDSVEAERALAFTEGRLVLRDTPVESLRELLQRWYGLVLTVDPALQGRRVTDTFTNESRAVVVETLALSLGTRAELRGDSVAFTRPDAP